MSAPIFAEAVVATQTKMRQTIDPSANIRIYRTLNDNLIETILKVDAYKFRQELRYRREEVIEHSKMPGFILITAETGGQPLGLVYGYDETDGGFFLDTLASMVEGRGIGHTLATLITIHAENTRHTHVTLYTEEEDEMGRRLRQFYQRMGYAYIGTQPEGDVMVMEITSTTTMGLFTRYVTGVYVPMPAPIPIPA